MIRIRTPRNSTYWFDSWEMVYWFMDQMSIYAIGITFPKDTKILTREEDIDWKK